MYIILFFTLTLSQIVMATTDNLPFCQSRNLKLKAAIKETFYPEGPTKTPVGIVFVEYSTNNVMKMIPGTKKAKILWTEKGCGPASSIATNNGTILVSCYDSRQVVEIDLKGNLLARHTHALMTGPNDFAKDSKGNIYLTDSGLFEPTRTPEGSIYFLPFPHYTPKPILKNLSYPNGIQVTEKELIISEHFKQHLLTYSLKKPGELKSTTAKIFATLPFDNTSIYNGADGFKLRGNDIWVAHYGTGRIEHFAHNGLYLGAVQLDMNYKNVTNILVIGQKKEKLLITVSNENDKESYPGKILELDLTNFPQEKFSCQF